MIVKQQNTNKGGITFVGALQIAFIVLKLCHVIDWSWWYVLAPAFISILLTLIIVLVLLGVFVWKEMKN